MTELPGPTPPGPTPQGPTPQGPTPQGPTPQGPTPQGPTPQGPTPQGPTPPDTARAPHDDAPAVASTPSPAIAALDRDGCVAAVRHTLKLRVWRTGDPGSGVASEDDLVDVVADWLVGAVIERPD